MKRYCFIMLLALSGLSLNALAAVSATTQAEVKTLLTRLEGSGCQFNRNGTWYSAVEAKAHLTKKYDYLVNKGWVSDTESFIERAATKSSMTGKAYEVKCGEQATVPSATWLKDSLKEIRASKP